ncbi:uncharacterized protein LOC119185356 isoform X2 [Rhipicephalus microplus]|uniref:uncharacterized protein LOC119185356 isoform X2 n=1 Tax=Rhipicephalus microplus TaxID=6941 RepID=UPI003F6C03FF
MVLEECTETLYKVTLFPGRCAGQSALRFTSRRAHSCARCSAVASAEQQELSRCDDGLWPRARPWRVTPERARSSKHVRDPSAAATPAHVARGHRAVGRAPT